MTDLPHSNTDGRHLLIPVTGRSMLPTLIPGLDEVTVDTGRPPEMLDIALALESDTGERPRFILHRIVGFSNGKVTMMGDGNLNRKEHFPVENILGVVTEIHRGNRIFPPSRLKGRLWWWLRPLRRAIIRIHPAFRKRPINPPLNPST